MTYNAFGQTLTIDGPRTETADVTTNTYYDRTDPCAAVSWQREDHDQRGGSRDDRSTAYDVDGHPTRVTDPNGVVDGIELMTCAVAFASRTVNAGGPLAETTRFDYDNVGQLVATTMPDGSVLRYQYDAAHRLTEIADGLGNVIQYTLDAMGNRIKEDVFDPSGSLLQRTQRRVYDADSIGSTTTSAPAAQKSDAIPTTPTEISRPATDPLNRNTLLNYDAFNRLHERRRMPPAVSPGTATTPKDRLAIGAGSDQSDDDLHVRWDSAISDAACEPRHGNRDLCARMPPATWSDRPTRAASRRPTSTTRSIDGRCATFNRAAAVALEYDNTDRPAARTPRAGLTKVTDPSGITTYLYDAFGRVVRKTQTVGSDATAKTFATSYQYASRTADRYHLSVGAQPELRFRRPGTRDRHNRWRDRSVLSGATYFPFGPVQGWTWANGQGLSAHLRSGRPSRDGDDRPGHGDLRRRELACSATTASIA